MKIGISQRVLEHNGNLYDSIDQHWYRFLSGHEIIPIPNRIDQNFKNIALSIDRLILSGGEDTAIRVKVETELFKEMLRNCKPVLGICHGAFLLTELLNGQYEECLHHHNTFHNIFMDNCEYIVNSFHKYQIKTPPSYATVLATDSDGYCEAWNYKDISAIVWHPERMDSPIIPQKIIDIFFK